MLSFKRPALFHLMLLTILVLAAPASGRYVLMPGDAAEAVPVGRPTAFKDYLLVGEAGVRIPLVGPGEISGYAKMHFAPDDTLSKTVLLSLSGVSGLPTELSLSFDMPRRGEYADGRPGRPSGGKKIALSIPAGEHDLMIGGGGVDGAGIFLLLYYEGPPQPVGVHVLASGFVPPEPPKEKKPFRPEILGFRISAYSGLNFTYNDNACGYSSTYIDAYLNGGSETEKYQYMDRVDDAIISPSLELRGRRKIWDIGNTDIKLKWARNQFWHNEKLANEEYRATLRQGTGKGKSIEFYYSYSPSKYLRQLNDRPPDVSHNTSVTSQEFRLTRNKLVATWRQKLNKQLSLTLRMTNKLYYYNRPHLENDITAFEWQGIVAWTLNKPFRLTLDYTFRDANALGIDVEGQELTTSPASDGTYRGNKYNVELRWVPPFKKHISNITLRVQYAVDYFSAKGTDKIEDDAYHVGRQDNYYTYQIKGSRKLPYYPKVRTSFGFSYAERDVDSPWWGDIKEDKNWISRTCWLGFSYKLF